MRPPDSIPSPVTNSAVAAVGRDGQGPLPVGGKGVGLLARRTAAVPHHQPRQLRCLLKRRPSGCRRQAEGERTVPITVNRLRVDRWATSLLGASSGLTMMGLLRYAAGRSLQQPGQALPATWRPPCPPQSPHKLHCKGFPRSWVVIDMMTPPGLSDRGCVLPLPPAAASPPAKCVPRRACLPAEGRDLAPCWGAHVSPQ